MRRNTGLLRRARAVYPQHVSTQGAICAVVGVPPASVLAEGHGGARIGRWRREIGGQPRRWRTRGNAGVRHGLAGVRVSQTCRKRAQQQRSNHARSLARADHAGESGGSSRVAICGSRSLKCSRWLGKWGGARSLTAGPHSRQAGLRHRDRAKPLAKRVCGFECKQFSSLDQDHAKHVG